MKQSQLFLHYNAFDMYLSLFLFEAPASARFHGSYDGGLLEHSLNVYDCLKDYLQRERVKDTYQMHYSEETIAIVSLLHDLCKINCYKKGTRNVKKDDFDQIDQDVENDTSKQDVKALTQTILDGYDKIKEGITQDNQEEAKKVYEAASRLEYIEKNTDQKLSSEEKEILELGKKTKTLMMHYYGNGEGVFQDAVDDVENGIDRVKNFTEEKWNDFKDKLE